MPKKQQDYLSSSSLLLVLLLTALLIWLTVSLSYHKHLNNLAKEKQIIQSSAHYAKCLLQENLYQGLSVARTLSYIIEHSGVPDNFDMVGRDLLERNRSIQAVEIVEKGTITRIYPYEENKTVLGYDILADNQRNKEAFKAIKKNDMFFAGPLELKQGGIGIVGRLPIFMKDSFFGFSAVVIKLDSLLSGTGIYPSYNPEIEFQLSKINPNTGKEEFFIAVDDDSVFEHCHSVKIDVPIGEWKLYARMKKPVNLIGVIPYSIAGILMSLLIGAFAFYKTRQPYELKRLVEKQVDRLNKNEKLLSITQKTARVGSWEADLVHNSFHWTDTVREILELDNTSEGSLQQLIDFAAEGYYRQTLQNKIASAVQYGMPFELELLLITSKGHERWVRTTCKAEMKNGICSHLYGATQDIHMSKLAKEEQIDILQSITDAFIATDNQWTVTFWNSAAEKMFEIQEPDIMGKNLWDHIQEKTGSRFHTEFLLALKNGEVRHFNHYFSGLDIWVDISLYPKHGGISAYLRDITLHHKHTDAIESQNKKLREIAWMQSHVIRAPLARLMASIELLRFKDDTDENKQKLIELIAESGSELDNIIKNISDKTTEMDIPGNDEDMNKAPN